VTSKFTRVFLALYLLFDTKNHQSIVLSHLKNHKAIVLSHPECQKPTRKNLLPAPDILLPPRRFTNCPALTSTICQRRPPLDAAAAGPTQATSPGGSREAMTLRASSHILPASPPVMRGCTMMRTPLPAYSLPSCMFMG